MMAPGKAADGSNDPQADLKKIPLWLTLQRCRGVGWLYSGHGGCLGLGDSGRGAAVFSRVVLVPAEEVVPSPDDATVVDGSSSSNLTQGAYPVTPKRPSSRTDATLRVLDSIAPVEVEAAAGEAAEGGGYGDAGGLFAAILSPSVPTETEANEAKDVQGDFLVMHRVHEETPPGDEGVEELHLCFGELLWHPVPPRLFACRSLWAAPQRMRLTKSIEQQQQPAGPTGAIEPAAAGSNPVLVLTDIEEGDAGEQHPHNSIAMPSLAGVPLAALRNLRGALGDKDTLHRVASDTLSLSLASLRQVPATITRISSATAEVIHNASADWAALGTSAVYAAAAAGARIQRLWKDVCNGKGSDNTGGENGKDSIS